MKGLLNVLYRRILYKIPLKFLLILLAVFGLFFASANAQFSEDLNYNFKFSTAGFSPSSFNTPIPLKDLNVSYITRGTMCYVRFIGDTCNCTYAFSPSGSIFKQTQCSCSGNFVVQEKNGWDCGTLEFSLNGTKDIVSFSDFSPVITGLNNSFNEFIPYVVYVGLGVLGLIFDLSIFNIPSQSKGDIEREYLPVIGASNLQHSFVYRLG